MATDVEMGDSPALSQDKKSIQNGNLSAFASAHGGGLTKREYFAGLAMQGICQSLPHFEVRINDRDIACKAVQIADALLLKLQEK